MVFMAINPFNMGVVTKGNSHLNKSAVFSGTFV